MNKKVVVVVIGRNEGERLKVCLSSLLQNNSCIVYVDSGSSDGSVEFAKSLGILVKSLDLNKPFTAARARNFGVAVSGYFGVRFDYVQFVDGDCEMVDGWVNIAEEFLDSNQSCVAVFGRLSERNADHSIYNWLCQKEWEVTPGDVDSCGGIAMFRFNTFSLFGGFREGLIAGEESELCLRLRRAGWKIRHLDDPMAIHDAAIYSFRQWWRRTIRSGHAFAEGAWLHGAEPERHWVAETLRSLIWGLGIPLLMFVFVCVYGSGWFALLLLYPLQVFRLSLRYGSFVRALFLVVGKFAEAWGAFSFFCLVLFRRHRSLIEYK